MADVDILDSRRLTGPNLLLGRPGAILDVACPDEEAADLVEVWREEAGRILRAVGWPEETLACRIFSGGASLVLSAPIDALYAATEVNEAALDAARARRAGEPPPDPEETTRRLRREIEEERSPALLRLRDAADRHGVAYLSDEGRASVGLGRGSKTFDRDDLPDPAGIDWSEVFDVPLAVVTGTNGKSTTVRLLASMAAVAGRRPGLSSTDGVVVGEEVVEPGDFSGPEGARRVLRDPRVEVAILETARGGLLRRGLAVRRADVALVTNVAEDHLGEWGVGDLATLTRTKLIVHHAIGRSGRLVLNAEDPELVRESERLDVPRAWFALDGENATIRRQVAAGREAAWRDGNTLVRVGDRGVEAVVGVDEIPITLAGAARHNVANALAAMLVGSRLGFDRESIAGGLRRFSGSPGDNPGRGNLIELGGDVRAFVDYAHNPHGLRAVFETISALPAERKLVVLGQAGDRSDEDIRELARIAWAARPDRVVIKEMAGLLRGRAPGEVPAILEDALGRLGAGEDVIERADSDLDAVRRALRWARPADLLLLLVHAERPEILDLLDRLSAGGWRAGDDLPE